MSNIPYSPPMGADPLFAGGVVQEDLPWRKCEYNLRGLSPAGRCPECGTPVGLSVGGDLLRFADPNWLLTLARGTSLILWGILLSIVGGIVSALLGIGLLVLAVSVVASLVMLFGAWQLTEPDPSGLGEEQYGTARKLIRIGLIAALIDTVLEQGFQLMTPSRGVVIGMVSVSLVFGLLGLIGHFAMLRYLGKLAMRIPDLQAAARARFLFWAYGGSLAAMLVFGALAFLISESAGRGAVPVFGCGMGIAALGLLIFGLMFLFLLSRLGKTFREQAALAQQVWSAPPAPPAAPPAAEPL